MRRHHLDGRVPTLQGGPAGRVRGASARRLRDCRPARHARAGAREDVGHSKVSTRHRSRRTQARPRRLGYAGPHPAQESLRMTSLPESKLRDYIARLRQVQDAFARHYPGEQGTRQPVHTVYGGAQLFKSDTTRKLGDLAVKALDQYAPEPRIFADAIGLDARHAETVHARVRKKLQREAVEDFRVDFEDGYGIRSDEEEDGHAQAAGDECAKGLSDGTLPPFIGIRIKSFSAELGGRALRTLDLFTSALARRAGKLPPGFVVTLPKVVSPDQVSVLIDAFEELEPRLGLSRGTLKMEPMIETTQAILDSGGESMLPKLLVAARGRCVAAHFGTYDYTASCDITAMHQSMRHPACDFAKHMMKVAYAGPGIWLPDGAPTNMP